MLPRLKNEFYDVFFQNKFPQTCYHSYTDQHYNKTFEYSDGNAILELVIIGSYVYIYHYIYIYIYIHILI